RGAARGSRIHHYLLSVSRAQRSTTQTVTASCKLPLRCAALLTRDRSSFGVSLRSRISTAARCIASGTRTISRRFKIGLPRLDRHRERRVGVLAPQFAALEAHGIEPLRVLACADRDGVGEDVEAAHAFDHARAAARVARQPGVGLRMDVLRANAV